MKYEINGTVLTDQPDANGEIIDFKGLEVPDEVSVNINFEKKDTVGNARLKKADKTVEACVEIDLPEKLPKSCARILVPAIGGRIVRRNFNIIEECKIEQIAFVAKNIDDRIKPMVIVGEEEWKKKK